jgi:hypothetical protein
MHKLQDTIDTVFGNVAQKPGPHEPSEVAIQRDRRFVELANRIEKLKQARLLAQARQ